MKKEKFFRKLGAMLLAGILMLAPISSVSAANDLPDSTVGGSITVHKILSSVASNTPGTGKELTAAETAALGTPGEDIGFTLYKVNSSYPVTNATTVAQALANAAPVTGAAEAAYQTTDSDGKITWTFAANARGYYVLVEDPTTAVTGYAVSPDAIIALPYAVDDDAWNYDIHVYPKNVNEKELVKTIDTPATGYSVGDVITWEYLAKVDTSKIYTDAPEAFGTFSITDTIDERLTFSSTSPAFTSTVVVKGVGGTGDVTLAAGTDYTQTDTTAADGKVVWSLTADGIKKLADAKATGVTVSFTTKINEKAYTGTTSNIDNGGTLAWQDPTGSGESGGYTIPDPEKPKADLYNIIIDKTNNDGSKKLAGAVFKIATSEANAEAETFLKNTDGSDATVTTDANGYAMFSGLPVDAAADTTFWLVEVTAPTTSDGEYVRPGEAMAVILYNVTGTTTAQKLSTSVTIKNYLPDDPDIPDKWHLPLTGGIGTTMFYVIGAVLMIGAAAIYLRSRKTKTTH